MTAYIEHLAQAQRAQAITARENICSIEGKVIIGQGVAIDELSANALSQYKLAKPIEKSIQMQEPFTSTRIHSLLIDYIKSDPALVSLHQLSDLTQVFTHCVNAFSAFPVLKQKLTILAIQMPEIFDQALFCAWLAVTVYARKKVSQNELDEIFIACLSHDFGMLDVAPAIVFKKDQLEPAEWKTLQQHPIHSAMLLQNLGCCSGKVIRAVAEHHESCDGTGYPKNKFEKNLSDLGRLLNLLDSANAIYRKHVKSSQRSFRDLAPILQIATLERSGPLGLQAIALFRQTEATAHCAIATNQIPDTIAMLKMNASEIKDFVNITSSFSASLGTKHKDLKMYEMQTVSRMIRIALNRCGIINEAYLRWLDQVKLEKLDFAYRELEDVVLMSQEIKFHMHRYESLLNSYIKLEAGGKFIAQAKELKQRLDDSLRDKY